MSLKNQSKEPLHKHRRNSINEILDIEIILIDNFDSFTYNLVNQLQPLVSKLKVFRNNTNLEKLIEQELSNSNNKIIVISPGPGKPKEAGISIELISQFKGVIPILGICLGHQAIVENYGGNVGAAKNICHGKADDVELDINETEIFYELPTPFKAARYHSLAAIEIPEALNVIAKCGREVMAIKHNGHKVLGFQFHPESILTPKGTKLMKNSLLWLSQ